jgi:hypothetical protein
MEAVLGRDLNLHAAAYLGFLGFNRSGRIKSLEGVSSAMIGRSSNFTPWIYMVTGSGDTSNI